MRSKDIIDAALLLSEAERAEVIQALRASMQRAATPGTPRPLSGAATSGAALGVDGCRAGWVAVTRGAAQQLEATVVSRFADVLALAPAHAVIAVDVPIGLPTCVPAGGRDCDRSARTRLGARASSVFSPPCRAALDSFRQGHAHPVVSQTNRDISGAGLSIQAYGILDKIAEVDDLITPELQARVIEVHPEVCFAAANGHRALTAPKKREEGRAERVALLEHIGLPVSSLLGARRRDLVGAGRDDILDACIALWTAERHVAGIGERIPDHPTQDDRGLRMEIWF